MIYAYRTRVTQVTITVIVENVTLTEEEVAEIFNRVPLQTLETYLPLPLFSAEVKEEPHVGQSQRRQSVRLLGLQAFIVAVGGGGGGGGGGDSGDGGVFVVAVAAAAVAAAVGAFVTAVVLLDVDDNDDDGDGDDIFACVT